MIYSTLIFAIASIAIFFAIYVLVSLSLNVQQGYAGIANLGLHLPIALGGFVIALLPGRLLLAIYGIGLDFVSNNAQAVSLTDKALRGNPLLSISLLLVTIMAALFVGLLAGYILSVPVNRLEGTYQAVFLLVVAEGVRTVGRYYTPIAGGAFGLSINDYFAWLGADSYLALFIVILTTVVIAALIIDKLCNAPFGRLLKSIRENALTAECVGKATLSTRMHVLGITSAVLALAGVLLAISQTSVVAEAYSSTDFAFWPWLMLSVGGSGNNRGVVLGTFLLVMLRRLFIYSKGYLAFLPVDPIWLEPILLGTALILIMLFRPEGLLPEKFRKL